MSAAFVFVLRRLERRSLDNDAAGAVRIAIAGLVCLLESILVRLPLAPLRAGREGADRVAVVAVEAREPPVALDRYTIRAVVRIANVALIERFRTSIFLVVVAPCVAPAVAIAIHRDGMPHRGIPATLRVCGRNNGRERTYGHKSRNQKLPHFQASFGCGEQALLRQDHSKLSSSVNGCNAQLARFYSTLANKFSIAVCCSRWPCWASTLV